MSTFYDLLNAAVLKAADYVTAALPMAVFPYGKNAAGAAVPLEVGTNGLKVESPLPAGAATDAELALILARQSDATQIANVRTAIGTWTPATAAAAADSAVIKNTACKVGKVLAANSHATTTYYLQLFDSATVPADATAPRLPSIPLPAGQTIMLDLGGMTFAKGLSWSDSTTVATKTVAATTPFQVSAEIL